MEDLKPCPFCGCEAELLEYDDEVEIRVNHKEGCWISEFNGFYIEIYDEQEAIKAWNTRYVEKRKCQQCSKEYVPTDKKQKYCSKDCKHKAHYERCEPELKPVIQRIYGLDS